MATDGKLMLSETFGHGRCADLAKNFRDMANAPFR